MYIIESTKSTTHKLASDYATASKIATQLTNVFGVLFTIREINDVWSVNNDK